MKSDFEKHGVDIFIIPSEGAFKWILEVNGIEGGVSGIASVEPRDVIDAIVAEIEAAIGEKPTAETVKIRAVRVSSSVDSVQESGFDDLDRLNDSVDEIVEAFLNVGKNLYPSFMYRFSYDANIIINISAQSDEEAYALLDRKVMDMLNALNDIGVFPNFDSNDFVMTFKDAA